MKVLEFIKMKLRKIFELGFGVGVEEWVFCGGFVEG